MKNTSLLLLSIFFFLTGWAQFLPEQALNSSFYNHGFAHIDLDGDGDREIVHSQSNQLKLRTNDGTDILGPAVDILPYSTQIQVAEAADIDGDGDEDLVIGSYEPGDYYYSSGQINWYENNMGSFTIRRQVAYSWSEIESMIIDDIDGDGNIDAMYIDKDWDEILWNPNPGGGWFSYSFPDFIAYVPGIEKIMWEDIDGDGLKDIVALRTIYSGIDTDIFWFRNLGGGSFDTPIALISNSKILLDFDIADFNSDGLPDIVSVERFPGKIFLSKNLGGASFTPGEIILDSEPYLEVVVAEDLDADGDIDIVSSSVEGTDTKVFYLENSGGDLFSPPIVISDKPAGAIEVFDYNGDGDLDILYGDPLFGYFQSSFMRDACSTSAVPANLQTFLLPSKIVLDWDVVPGSEGCRITAQRTSPPGPTVNYTEIGPNVSSLVVPISALGPGTTWDWAARCACSLSPLDLTGLSATNTFSIPLLRASKPDAELTLYPNPAKGSTCINLPSDQFEIRIYDIQGELLHYAEGSNTYCLNTTSFPAGVYFVSAESKVQSYQGTLVVAD